MRYLRTNTAIRLTVGPFLDKTDGITPEVALTVTNCHLTLMVDTADVPTLVLDANATASAGSNDMVHVTNDDAGFYDLELTAAQLNYLGRALLSINDVATHCPVFHEFMLLPANVYDALVLGTDALQVHTNEITADLITAAVIANGAIDAATFAAGAIDAAAIAPDAIGASEFAQGAADKVWASATRTLTAFSTALAVAVWDVLESAIAVASSIGVKLKNTLPQRIVKNTALSNFEFLMIDSADHVTGKTGLTVTAERSIDGAAFGACANAVTEVSAGVYKINLAATDLNGDVITLKFTAAGADARLITIVTEPAAA